MRTIKSILVLFVIWFIFPVLVLGMLIEYLIYWLKESKNDSNN